MVNNPDFPVVFSQHDPVVPARLTANLASFFIYLPGFDVLTEHMKKKTSLDEKTVHQVHISWNPPAYVGACCFLPPTSEESLCPAANCIFTISTVSIMLLLQLSSVFTLRGTKCQDFLLSSVELCRTKV